MKLVLLKIKQAKTRGIFKRKNVLDEKTVRFEPSIPELQLDTLNKESNLIQTRKFRAA